MVYYNAGDSFSSSRETNFSASGTSTIYYASGIDSYFSAFTQSNSTDSSSYASGNYVIFTGLTAATEDVAMNYVTDNMTLNGFAILGTPSSVPEPSTWALLFIGAAFIWARQRIKNVY